MAAVALNSKAIGSTVKLKVDGTARDFIIVHKGKPSSLYDSSCDGIWLLLKDCLEQKQWHASNVNDYANSDLHKYLNNTWIKKLDANIQAQVKQVKIPYRPGSGTSKTVNSGANGLSCKVFLLSGYEVGWTQSTSSYFPIDGAVLSYFQGTAATDAKRIANYNGSATFWWLRSPNTHYATYAWYVGSVGYYNGAYCSGTFGVRPALILPSSLLVSDDGSVNTNTAPTTPGSITIPESIQGGQAITVSWAASTDAENNLDGYVVERSTDGGSTWTQVYQGSALTTTNTVPAGSATVMYRVKAYDVEGLYSGYRNSAQVTVFNNAAPEAPPSISVPEEVTGGGTLTVTWGAASDPDENLTGYELERQVNGGEWAQVYKGAETSYTDNITRGWASVNYRVRSYDSYNAVSGYTTGIAQPVNNNRAPVITCSTSSGTDLGTKSDGFSIAYSVSDEDGDSVTVTEAIDDADVRTFTAESGAENTFAVTGETFMKILNGEHSLSISAGDGKATVAHNLTFTKSVTQASITLSEPFEADDKITLCVLSVQGSIPADAEYKVEVTNNAKDDTPVWEDCTVEVKNGGNHVFTNETAANGFAFNFRVSVKRGTSGQGGYINSVQGGFQ